MKVRAIKVGFYGGSRRYPANSNHWKAGAPFDLVPYKKKNKKGEEVVVSVDEQFSEKWMEKVEEAEPKKAPVPEKKAPLAAKPAKEVI